MRARGTIRSAAQARTDTSIPATTSRSPSRSPGQRIVHSAAHLEGKGGAINLRMEHEIGPLTGLAQILGTVNDHTGAVIPDATISLRYVNTAETRRAHSNAAGQFDFAGLARGRYSVEISSQDFLIASISVVVHGRDHAVLSATFAVGNATQTVEIASTNVLHSNAYIAWSRQYRLSGLSGCEGQALH